MESLRNSVAVGGGGWRVGLGARRCDSCKEVSASVFCRVDSAFLCLTCDAKIHNGKVLNRHERVWMCEVCEQAPAAVSCRADAAALCVSCDADIHSANPLAGRHERVPVEPSFDSAADAIVKSSSVFQLINDDEVAAEGIGDGSSWVLEGVENINPAPSSCKSGDHHLFIPDEMTTFLTDLDHHHHNKPNSMDYDAIINGLTNCAGADSHVVPVQASELDPLNNNSKKINNDTENSFNVQFCSSNFSSFTTYPSQSFTHSVSSSSYEFGVVSDGNSVPDSSYPFAQISSGSGSSNPNLLISEGGQSQMYATKSSDREAKVLRFREKRKNRKFEKTIRYASRKAYAETRPRVKGRFAKRSLNISLMESHQLSFQTLSSVVQPSFMGDDQCGVVPSF